MVSLIKVTKGSGTLRGSLQILFGKVCLLYSSSPYWLGVLHDIFATIALAARCSGPIPLISLWFVIFEFVCFYLGAPCC